MKRKSTLGDHVQSVSDKSPGKSRFFYLKLSVPISNNEIINTIPSSHRDVVKILNKCEALT